MLLLQRIDEWKSGSLCEIRFKVSMLYRSLNMSRSNVSFVLEPISMSLCCIVVLRNMFRSGKLSTISTTTRIGQYELGKTIGRGAFAEVKQATHMITKVQIALKIVSRNRISRSDTLSEMLKREIQVLGMLRHPHILRLYEVIETPSDLFLVMQLASGGELFNYIRSNGKLQEEEARRLFQQLVSALCYCHEHKNVHRDIKLENLLITTDGDLKLSGFGLAGLMQDGEFLQMSCGPPIAAPEIVWGDPYAGPEVDCWSAGIVLYAMLAGSYPFDINELIRKRSARYKIDFPVHFSEDSQDLISKMVCVDPIKRITFAEIRRHPWFMHHLPSHLDFGLDTCYG